MINLTYLILAEKPSAAKNMADALGGMTGTFEGQKYKIVSLYGHMLTFAEPHEMVSHVEQENFESWQPEFMPWDISKLDWSKVPQKSRSPRTGKISSKQDGIDNVKKASKGCSSIVIGTDKDPSGEGQLIGWEVIQAIGWTGDVKRMYFIDESDKGLQQGFRDIEDLPSYDKDGEYVKADVRSRWDFISMQLTRLSTQATRTKGYSVVVRQGRLKSVMTKLVADQLALVKAYKKKPYFEVKYKDDLGNNYGRKFDEDVDTFRYPDKKDATNDMKNFNPSDVVEDSKTKKKTAPGKLLDLGGLASILGSQGYKSKEVLATYQKMYEAKIVSYPRTEDKIISKEQFKEMLPLVNKIADVVGADKSLLTHKSPRSTHVKDGGAHGANRPGLVVPTNLKALSKFGKSAEAIYDILGKNFLAMFGEDYEYFSVKGHIKDHPEFKTTVSIPIDLGFKAIFDADKESSDEQDEDFISNGLGKTGTAFISEGVNKKPPHPTHKWLEKQLSKYDVGTGATRVGTLSDVTSGKTALLTDTRGKLDLTKIGLISSVLLEGSYIGDPVVTEKLFKSMKDVGELKLKPKVVLETATALVKHDKEVFYSNASKLEKLVGKPDMVVKEKISGVYSPTGERIQFNIDWSGHRFTDKEIESLLNGEDIRIDAISNKSKKAFTVDGKLGESEYKGKKFWGFQPEFKNADDYDITTAPFPKEWSGYKFKQTDEVKLRLGEEISITAISKAKKPFDVDVTFGISEYNGNKGWRIIPHFKKADDFDIKSAKFPKEWSGHKFTKAEEDKLRDGKTINIKAISKVKKPYEVDVSFGIDEYKGNKSWKIIPHFKEFKKADEYTREDAPFKTIFSGYQLSDEEIKEVRKGNKIMVTATSSKTGNDYTCNLSLEINEYKGKKSWGLKPHFD